MTDEKKPEDSPIEILITNRSELERYSDGHCCPEDVQNSALWLLGKMEEDVAFEFCVTDPIRAGMNIGRREVLDLARKLCGKGE